MIMSIGFIHMSIMHRSMLAKTYICVLIELEIEFSTILYYSGGECGTLYRSRKYSLLPPLLCYYCLCQSIHLVTWKHGFHCCRQITQCTNLQIYGKLQRLLQLQNIWRICLNPNIDLNFYNCSYAHSLKVQKLKIFFKTLKRLISFGASKITCYI